MGVLGRGVERFKIGRDRGRRLKNIHHTGFCGLIYRRGKTASRVDVVDGVAIGIGVKIEAEGVADGIGA